MRRTILAAALLVLGLPQPAWPQSDSARPRREELRQRIEERFAAKVRRDLDLTEDQATRLRETGREFNGRRRELESRERELRSALEAQLRPGVAADRDSVTRLTDALVELRGAWAQTFRDEHRRIATFLDPVQRAQLYMMRERLMRRAHEVHRGRGGGSHFRGDSHFRGRGRSWSRDSA